MADPAPSAPAGEWLPDVVTVKLTVFELGILTGMTLRWAAENKHAPAAQRVLDKLIDAARPFYPPEEPHPHGR